MWEERYTCRRLKLVQLLGQLRVLITSWKRFPHMGYGLSEAQSPVNEVRCR
jgi:hypothetical protein